MKKSVAFLSLACACASVAYADNAQWSTTFFNGIGDSPSLSAMGATNGSWGFPAENAGVSIDDDKLVLDLDASDNVTFTIATAGEASTAHAIYAKAVFTPVKPADLIAGSTMNDNSAQIGFAVVKIDSTPTYKYYAWVGGQNGAAAVNDWVALADCSDPDAETDLKIDLAYWTSTVTATFSVKSNGAYSQIGSVQTVTSDAKSAGKVASLACTGSGTISAISGDYQYGVASLTHDSSTVKYPTAEAAMDAAVSGDTVTINKDLTSDTLQVAGTVTAKDGVSIVNEGYQATIDTSELSTDVKVQVQAPAEQFTTTGGTSGEYTIPASVGSTDKLEVVLPASVAEYKQIKSGSYVQGVGGSVSFVVETKDDIIPGDDKTNMRKFLDAMSSKVSSYTAANPTTADIQDEMDVAQTGAGENGLTLTMDYALGITPTDSIAPTSTPSTDTEEGYIKLSIPAIGTAAWANNSDYDITYKCMNGDTIVEEDLEVPMIPLDAGSGTYKIIVVAAPPVTPL